MVFSFHWSQKSMLEPEPNFTCLDLEPEIWVPDPHFCWKVENLAVSPSGRHKKIRFLALDFNKSVTKRQTSTGEVNAFRLEQLTSIFLAATTASYIYEKTFKTTSGLRFKPAIVRFIKDTNCFSVLSVFLQGLFLDPFRPWVAAQAGRSGMRVPVGCPRVQAEPGAFAKLSTAQSPAMPISEWGCNQ